MQQEDPNYGTQREEPRLNRIPAGGGMSAQDERMWSMLAHLSVLVNLVTGIGGPIAALVIWLVYKDRSRKVSFHALQSLWYQVAWIVLITAYVIVSSILVVVFIGIFMLFLTPLIALIPIIHQCYAAYKVNQGVDYRYPVIADMIDRGRRTV
ncbi:MAG: DUF4870 domain-containing protein [Rubrobacter sp.]|nr:DUF4870 domain-containing protein [Rubrobacter sp.]